MSRNALAPIVILAAVKSPFIPKASAANDRPFKASLTGNAHPVFVENSPVVINDETGVGNATQLGRFQWADEEVAIFSSPTHADVTGTFTMTAANGDTLIGTLETEGDVVDGMLFIHGTFQFTGGTGRFIGATGGGTIDAIGDFAPPFEFTGTFKGVIRY